MTRAALMNMAALSLALLLAIGCGARSTLPDGAASSCDVPERTGTPRAVIVKEVKEIGALGRPASVTFRDGGSSARVGSRLVWTFGDTLLSMPAEDGQPFRSSSAAYAKQDGDLLSVADDTDANGAPRQLVPFTADEQAFNDTHAGDDRWALWPFATVGGCGGDAIVFYSKIRVRPGFLNFEAASAGVARLLPPDTVAARDPVPLWSAPDKMFVLGGLRDGRFLYLYACQPVPMALDQTCEVARAPEDSLDDRTSYRFWDGAAWDPDIQRAVPVLHGAPGDVSVSWNAHLDAFIAVHSAILSTDIVISTAPRPEGPWSAPSRIMSGLPPGPGPMSLDYAGKEHPELSQGGGKTLVITYARQLESLTGELRVAEVTLE